MMPREEPEFHLPGGETPLFFRWRHLRSPWLAKAGYVALAALVLVLPLSVIRIRVALPPVEKTHHASAMMLTSESDPMGWAARARAGGPFPSRFSPAEWMPAADIEREVLAAVRSRALPQQEPGWREPPAENDPPPPLLVGKGLRHLPPVPPAEIRPVAVEDVRQVPVFHSLTPGAAPPLAAPPNFGADVTPELASQPWRFLVELTPAGTVSQVVALTGADVDGRSEIATWLRGHRFASADDGPRWIAVAVTFQNRRIDGIDAP